jgi:hypothetical protein
MDNRDFNRNDQGFEALLGLGFLLVGRNMLIDCREVIYLFVVETLYLQGQVIFQEFS